MIFWTSRRIHIPELRLQDLSLGFRTAVIFDGSGVVTREGRKRVPWAFRRCEMFSERDGGKAQKDNERR